MKIRDFRDHFISELSRVLEPDEATSIFNIVLKAKTGMDRSQLALSPQMEFTLAELAEWKEILARLIKLEPVQYVLGESWFFGRRFEVCGDVLIPRPETEELVQWILASVKPGDRLLDIGTGSGCIAISLALEKPVEASALDVSAEALRIARQNASALGANVNFIHADILSFESPEKYEVIVSNPPYVRHLEKAEISDNVLRYEPHLALFVEDDDALLFYRAIANFAKKSLSPGGQLFFEINQYLSGETSALLREMGFENVEVRNDIYQNPRMIRAVRPYS